MNIKIAGAGTIGPGEYEEVSISGSGKVCGYIRCLSFDVAGSAHCDGKIECLGKMDCAGGVTFKDEVIAKNVNCSGGLRFEADCMVTEKLSSAGSVKFMASIKARNFQSSGYCYVEKDIEAEDLYVKGDCQIYGLVNAENIKIEFENALEINEIGGTNIIIIQKEKGWNKMKKAPIFNKICKSSTGKIGSIEGENIAVECIEASKIIGKTVAIGKDCKVKLVQYTDEYEIDSSSEVEKLEKVG